MQNAPRWRELPFGGILLYKNKLNRKKANEMEGNVKPDHVNGHR